MCDPVPSMDPWSWSELLSPGQIYTAIVDLASEVRDLLNEHKLSDPLLVGILDAAVPFATAFSQEFSHFYPDHEIQWIGCRSYKGTERTCRPYFTMLPLDARYRWRPIILLDCIVDSGATMAFATRRMEDFEASMVFPVSLVARATLPEDLKQRLTSGVVVFTEDFLVGYGLDFNGRYRGLPSIRRLPPERKTDE